MSEEVKSKVNTARIRGERMFKPCLVITSKAIYVLKLDEDPVSAFLDLVTHGKARQSEKIAACFELDSKALLELAADIKLTRNDYPGAISLYRQSGCKHLKAVLKFAASGHVQVKFPGIPLNSRFMFSQLIHWQVVLGKQKSTIGTPQGDFCFPYWTWRK